MKGVLEDTWESEVGEMAHEAVLSIITIKFNKSPVPHGSKIRRGLRGFEGGVASKRPSEASPDQNLANPVGSYGRTSSVKQNAAREREQNPNTPPKSHAGF